MKTQKVLGLILAGGQGSRMGGADKGLVVYKGEPLVSHVIKRLEPQCDDLIISANRNLESYMGLGHGVISDEKQDEFDGPLAGICAGAQYAKSHKYSALLISSCDTPHLPLSFSKTLMSSLHGTDHNSAVVFTNNQQQNTHFLVLSSAWESLLEFYKTGGRALHHWHQMNASLKVPFSGDNNAFKNYNLDSELAD